MMYAKAAYKVLLKQRNEAAVEGNSYVKEDTESKSEMGDSKNKRIACSPGLDQPAIKKSRKSSEKNVCQICYKSFAQKGHLSRHISTIHEGKKTFKCSLCKGSFSRNDTLTKHIESVHERKKLFNCDICETSFTMKSNLTKHIASVHERKRPHKCNICAASFTQKVHLKTHFACIHAK